MRNDSSNFYTSLEDAKEEIWERWRNDALRKKVVDSIGTIPHPMQESPRAVLDRNIATPNYEFFHFIQQANKTGLPILVTEYIRDKFVTINSDKLGLGRMPFYRGRNKKGRLLFRYRNVIDCTIYQGKPIGEIKTLWGETLADFHHRLLTTTSFSIDILDASSWYKSNGGNAENYYHNYLAMFICHGILFENFITNEEEERFSKSVVFPAFKQVVEHFGMKPLIVSLVPHDVASDIYWRCYPADIEEEVLRCLCQCEANQSSKRHDEAQREVRHGRNG
jgi:hypothetical protein